MTTLKFQKDMNRFYKKVKNYNKLSDYSDLIPHYYTKLIGVFILLGICIISVNLLDPLIFGGFLFVKSISFNYKEKLIIRLIAFISISTTVYICRGILKVIEALEKENKDDSKENVNNPSKKLKINVFEKDNYPFLDSSPSKEKKDIFTRKISNDDPLWRVRAYVIGFLLADGSISTPSPQKVSRSYRVTASQHEKDKDILIILQEALGGMIKPSEIKNNFKIQVNGKDLILKLLELGMVERHSKEEIACSLLPPNFIQNKIQGQLLVRDFIRGFFDGDGSFSGTYKDRTVRYGIAGPFNFLNKLNNLILQEIPELSSFITPSLMRVYKAGTEEHIVYSGFRIYKRGYGFYKLTPVDLETGKIEYVNHPWLKILHISGSFNCIRFFNWLYENNDNFDMFLIKDFRICGKRKFKKAFLALGNEKFRREKLAPDWKDIISEIPASLVPRFIVRKK